MHHKERKKTLESSCKERSSFDSNMDSSSEYLYIKCCRILHDIYNEYGPATINNNIFHLKRMNKTQNSLNHMNHIIGRLECQENIKALCHS